MLRLFAFILGLKSTSNKLFEWIKDTYRWKD
jgi:hypothetical protein